MKLYPKGSRPATKAEVKAIIPDEREIDYSRTRFRNGDIVPLSRQRPKRAWSFEGTHKHTDKNGIVTIRPGRYVDKLHRDRA